MSKIDQIIEDPDEVAMFIEECKAIESFEKKAKASALDMIDSGVKVPGFGAVSSKGAQYVSAAVALELLDKAKVSRSDIVAKLIGNVALTSSSSASGIPRSRSL